MRKNNRFSRACLLPYSARLTLVVGVLLSSLLLPPTPPLAHAAGATVVTTTSLLNNPNDGACSLREALQAAFSQAVNGTASQSYNECTTYAGPTTITFGGNAAGAVLKLTADQDPLPMINKAVIISGPVILQGGGTPAANATQRDTRLLRVASNGVLTLNNLTLKDGYVGGFGGAIFSNSTDSVINLYGVSLIGNYAEGDGGAIATNGQLNVVLSSFAGNKALGINGPNHAPADGYGGAIKLEGSDKLKLSQSSFSGNIASRGGGAIAVVGTTALISDTVFTGNIAQATVENSGGGALYNTGNGTFRIIRTFFSANLTPQGRGGAIYNEEKVAIWNSILEVGTNFLADSQAFWNGNPRPLQFVSGSKVADTLTGANLSAAGLNRLTRFNPAPSGGTSNALQFAVERRFDLYLPLVEK